MIEMVIISLLLVVIAAHVLAKLVVAASAAFLMIRANDHQLAGRVIITISRGRELDQVSSILKGLPKGKSDE